MGKSHWRIGVAGLGTVGSGLIGLIAARPGFSPTGDFCEITGVSARSRSRVRPVDVSGFDWCDDPEALAVSPDNDLFVELIGGAEGPARALVQAARGRAGAGTPGRAPWWWPGRT